MPSVTYDGRSFMLDGRRIWLVSGAIQYARIPEPLWASRIHAAKLAGLNCIETPVVWREHETRAGAFDFDGQRNIRRFLELIHKAGMVAILRVGPYVGSSLDFGGLPAWINHVDGARLRTGSQAFLDACGRFLLRLCEEIRDLQVTSPGSGGPIALVQNESHWTCGSAPLAAGYLAELGRYLREGGLNVPTVNTNNLWASVEGEIDAWSASEDLLATCRQLSRARPDQPRIIMDLSVTEPNCFAEPAGAAPAPAAMQRRLAEALAGLGQFNIDPFCGGSNHGFLGGALPGGPARFVTQTNDRRAPLSETGQPGPSFDMVRRICTFATHFGKVFSHANPEYRPTVIDPVSAGGGKEGAGVSVVHVHGGHGGCVFLFNADPAVERPAMAKAVTLQTPSGSQIVAHFGQQATRWLLHDVHLTGRAHLTETNLDAIALVGKTLVMCGPEGTPGMVSINGSPIVIEVPGGKSPEIIEHEGLTVVIASEKQMPRIVIERDAVYIGAEWSTLDGRPITPGSSRSCLKLDMEGVQSTAEAAPNAPKKPKTPTLGSWEHADVEPYIDGSSPRFATIDGPAELSKLGSSEGYGWYRIVVKSGAVKKVKVISPRARDRVHLFSEGKAIGILGVGPGASADVGIGLKRGDVSIIALADNMGRHASGSRLGELKGLVEHLLVCAPIKGAKPTVTEDLPIDLLGAISPLWEVRPGDMTTPQRATLGFIHRKKSPVVLRVENAPARALLLINDEVERFVDAGDLIELVLDSERLKRGANTVQLAPLEEGDFEDEKAFAQLLKQFGASMQILEVTANITEKAEWGFAKWEPPAAAAFEPMTKTKMGEAGGSPSWWRCRFESPAGEEPLLLDLGGMTKGQVYLNGRHIGRYWVATPTGEDLPPQRTVWLPGCWLDAENENELVLFDEHGGNPGRCKLLLGAEGDAALLT